MAAVCVPQPYPMSQILISEQAPEVPAPHQVCNKASDWPSGMLQLASLANRYIKTRLIG